MDEISSFLLSVIESSDDAIIGLTTDGHVVSWNFAAEKIYGYEACELVGHSIDKLSLPDRADETSLILNRILHGERVQHFQTAHLTKGGIPIPVSVSISPVIDNYGRIVGASYISRDLSHRLKFEKTLHESDCRYNQLKESLALAHQVQEHLLPSIDDIDCGIDLYAKTIYSEDVGGDYYDIFHSTCPTNRSLGLAVGDVSGHGTSAALLMAMAKGALQAEVEHFPCDLVSIMSRLNRFFSHHAKEGLFMTLFLALLDVQAKQMSWCSAGQGPVYIYHSFEQSFEELCCTGPPLGILDKADYESLTTKLGEGDVLIVGTDGLWEARNREGNVFSIERFRQVLATWHQKSAEEICSQMLSRVKKFTAKDVLDDDMSLLIVKLPAH